MPKKPSRQVQEQARNNAIAVVANGDNPIWQRMLGEPAKPYRGAKTYFEMGAERSCRKVWERYGVSQALVEKWARLYNWTTRALAFDMWQDAVYQQAMSARVREMSIKHAQFATELQGLAFADLRRWKRQLTKEIGENDDPALPLMDLVRVIDMSAKLERNARGVGEEVRIEHSGIIQHVQPNQTEDEKEAAGEAAQTKAVEIIKILREAGVLPATSLQQLEQQAPSAPTKFVDSTATKTN